VVGGDLAPEVGARLIWDLAWVELDFPPALQPIVGEVSEWEDWTPDWGNEREHYQRRIVAEMDSLLARPWPPPT
jgi:hypothetical protein